MKIVGKHVIAELYGVSRELISRVESVKEIMEKVTEEVGIEVIDSAYRQFEPHGVTAIMLVSDSHISLHTWPEYEMVNIDIFTCRKSAEKAELALKIFVKYFKPKDYRCCIVDRG